MTTSPWGVAVVSSDLENRRNVARMIERQGVGVVCAATVRQCREALSAPRIALVLCDPKLSDGTYRDILNDASSRMERSPKVVLMAAAAMKPEEYWQAKSCGLFDIVASPCRPKDIEWVIICAKRAENGSITVAQSPA